LKGNAASAVDFANALAKDKKFRKELISAISHGTIAQRRARRKMGYVALVTRLGTDQRLKRELQKTMNSLERAWARVERKPKPSHKVRNVLLVVGGVGAMVAVTRPGVRSKVRIVSFGKSPRTIESSIEVNVPASTAYNQWTQFEDFPLFMEGVDHVQQLDDTRLHWVATVAGWTAEWDAKILEQHPDEQISWISLDGKKTRGTVTFEPLGEDKTLVRLSMSYLAEGSAEQLGSAAGLDMRRVQGDLERFKELVESRGQETGAWRGEVTAGETQQ
jgi:uncharacterized membrane protein